MYLLKEEDNESLDEEEGSQHSTLNKKKHLHVVRCRGVVEADVRSSLKLSTSLGPYDRNCSLSFL